MIFAKAKFTEYWYGRKYHTRKERRKEATYPFHKVALKRQTAIKARRAKLEDETPYKRFSDPWFYV